MDFSRQRRSTNVEYGDQEPSFWDNIDLSPSQFVGGFKGQGPSWAQYNPDFVPSSLATEAGYGAIPTGGKAPTEYDAEWDAKLNFDPNSGPAADYNAGNWKNFGDNGAVWDDPASRSGDYGFDPNAPTQEMADEYKKGGTVKRYADGGMVSAAPAAAVNTPIAWSPAGTGGSMPPPATTQPPAVGGGSSGGINSSVSGYGAMTAPRVGNTQRGYIYTNPGGGVSYNGQAGLPGQQGGSSGPRGFSNWNGFRGFGRRFADGGAVEGEMDPTSDRDNITPNLNAALQTVNEIFRYGYQKHGLGALAGGDDNEAPAQAYADGGEVDDEEQAIPTDANGNEAQQAQPAQPQEQGFGDKIRGAFRSMPSPAEPFVQPVQKLLRMIQGADAMPVERSIAEEAGAPSQDENERKLMTAHKIAQQQGPDAAWSYLQSLRKQFDLHRTNAAVKARKGDMANSAHAANKAMTNVLDGMDTQFTPTPDGRGVRVRIKRVGQ